MLPLWLVEVGLDPSATCVSDGPISVNPSDPTALALTIAFKPNSKETAILCIAKSTIENNGERNAVLGVRAFSASKAADIALRYANEAYSTPSGGTPPYVQKQPRKVRR